MRVARDRFVGGERHRGLSMEGYRRDAVLGDGGVGGRPAAPGRVLAGVVGVGAGS